MTKHIWIEEETWKYESRYALESSLKVNNVESIRIMILKNYNKSKKEKVWGFEWELFNKKNGIPCYHCGKKGHFKRDCRFFKKKKKNEGNIRKKKVNDVEQPEDSSLDIIATISIFSNLKNTRWQQL